MRPLPITAVANRRRAKWARARRSFARGKISRQEMAERLALPWNHSMQPLFLDWDFQEQVAQMKGKT